MSDDKKKRVKKKTVAVEEGLLKEVGQLLNVLKMARLEEKSAPAVDGACSVPHQPGLIYRIITNGKRYRIEKSKNGGDTWMPVSELKKTATHREIREVTRMTYWGAKRFMRKQYGEQANLLPREWRAV